MGQDQDDLILAPYTTIQRRLAAIDYITGIYASAASEEKSAAAISEVEEILRRTHKLLDSEENDFYTMSQSELIETVSSITEIMTYLLGAIAGISLLVGGIGIMNIMFVSVTERTREIGLRMSIGGRGADILKQFLVESMLLSLSRRRNRGIIRIPDCTGCRNADGQLCGDHHRNRLSLLSPSVLLSASFSAGIPQGRHPI